MKPSMSAIAADADAKAALLSAVAADLDNFKAELMVSMQARAKAKTDHICKVLQRIAADASTLTGEARALLSAPSTAPTTSLRVAGTTGVTKQQARRQWKEARTQVAESWSKRREALARRLAELESLTDGSSHDADSKADLRASHSPPNTPETGNTENLRKRKANAPKRGQPPKTGHHPRTRKEKNRSKSQIERHSLIQWQWF